MRLLYKRRNFAQIHCCNWAAIGMQAKQWQVASFRAFFGPLRSVRIWRPPCGPGRLKCQQSGDSSDAYQLGCYMRTITVAPASVHATKPGTGGSVAGGIKGIKWSAGEARDRAQAATERLRPVLAPMAAGLSLREMSAALVEAGTTTKAGNPWSPSTVNLA